MNRFHKHFQQISSYDLIQKSHYLNTFQIPALKQITINLSSTHLAHEKKKIIPFLLLCELITGQKGKLTVSKKNKIQVKIKKGMVVGCKINLNQDKSYQFFENLITFIFPNLKEFQGYTIHPNSSNILSFSINNFLNFPELSNEYASFAMLPPLHITVELTSKSIDDTSLFLTSINFPIQEPLNNDKN